jgi:hypothetical protein
MIDAFLRQAFVPVISPEWSRKAWRSCARTWLRRWKRK